MNASQLFADIETGALVEVECEKCHYYDSARGLTVRQSFYIYPDDTIVSLSASDGGYKTIILSGDDVEIFRARNPAHFQ